MPVKNKELYQFCIFETYVDEVLALSSELQIEEITFAIGFSMKSTTVSVPRTLAELGVTYLREPSSSMEAQGKLTGSRTSMKRDMKAICNELSLDHRHMRVRRLLVSYGDATATFTRMTKKMQGDEGKTKRVPVLGHVVTEGTERDSVKILKVLGAKKVKCQYSVEPVRTVICST